MQVGACAQLLNSVPRHGGRQEERGRVTRGRGQGG
jgi:hypothetical protein